MSFPTLNSDRLILRPLRYDQLDVLIELVFSDPEVMKTLVGGMSTAELQREFAEDWLIGGLQGDGVWGIYSKLSDELLGTLYFAAPLDRYGEGPELGYALRQQAWDEGFTTEAARTAIDYLFNKTDAAAVEALVWDGLNPASSKVVKKLGMFRVGNYEALKYLGEEWWRRTVDFDLWRLSQACAEELPPTIREVSIRLGKFAGEGLMAKKACVESVLKSVGKTDSFRPQIERAISRYIDQGMDNPGFGYYRKIKQI